jgi:branched-chain amino acid transport system substrate-binding protein
MIPWATVRLPEKYEVDVAQSMTSRQWDYYKVLATIPGNEAFRSLNESGCPLIKQQ